MSDGLNLAQQEAVNYLHGPCLVLAGAGSGKTRVITHKIGRLIQAGLKPEKIAAICSAFSPDWISRPILCVMTRVLPEPAPASTRHGPCR